MLLCCHECGLYQEVSHLAPGENADCPRCNAALLEGPRHGLQVPLNLYLTGVVLFIIANVFPLMTLRVEGLEQSGHIISGGLEFFNRGFWHLGLLFFLVVFIVPLFKLLGGLYVVAPLYFGKRAPHAAVIFRWLETFKPWAMLEVFLLGIFVAYVKLVDMATIEIGVALISYLSLILVLATADSLIDAHNIWERMGPRQPARMPPSVGAAGVPSMVACHHCGMISTATTGVGEGRVHCPRCAAVLHHRKPNSLTVTWALVISAMVLYIPANVYPVMTITYFGSGEPDTILSGVVLLFEAGMWPLALLVFFASITVPVLKLIVMTYLLISTQIASTKRLRDRARLYRIVELVGRWSMIDVFMIAILIALVQFGTLTTIEAGIGVVAFASVVVLTMIAAETFDPRLMWDAAEARHDH